MLKDIIEVRHVRGYRLHLRFEDGLSGEVDVSKMIDFEGVFAPLRDESEFARVRVDREAGTIVWPGGADLDPDVLSAVVSGKPIAGHRDRGVGSPGYKQIRTRDEIGNLAFPGNITAG